MSKIKVSDFYYGAVLDIGKSSITISRKKNERAYRISVGGGRSNSMKIKANRFEELF